MSIRTGPKLQLAPLPYSAAYHFERLTELQRRYCEYRAIGHHPTAAARLAGYHDNGGSAIRVRAHKLERHPLVQALVEELRIATRGIAGRGRQPEVPG